MGWRSTTARVLLLATLLATAGPAGSTVLRAQQVARSGAGEPELDRRLDRLLASRTYLLVSRDTFIAAGDTVERPVLVLDAMATVEGTVLGDLVGVDANLFLRPTARVAGDVVNIGGGLYPSALAAVEGAVVDRPRAMYTVEATPGGYRIRSGLAEDRLALDGFMGVHIPTYDRVDGLSLAWGAAYRVPAFGGVEPVLRGHAGYRTERDAVTGAGRLELRREPAVLSFGAERLTVTNEEWIEDAPENSLAFFVKGSDDRNYHEVRRLFAEGEWTTERGSWSLVARLRAQLEEAESLPAGDPFTILDDPPFRVNPRIDDGRTSSLLLSGRGGWVGESAAVDGGLLVEAAEAVVGGDFAFGRFNLWGEWSMAALFDHVLEMEWYGQGLLPGTDRLPRQRWTFVGGSGTLNTFEIAEFRGDRVVYLETDYIIPLPRRWRLPILGAPDLELLHRVGMAWTDELERDLAQNVGIRLQFFSVYLRALTDPADPLDVDFDIGLSWPFGGDRPWQAGS